MARSPYDPREIAPKAFADLVIAGLRAEGLTGEFSFDAERLVLFHPDIGPWNLT